MWAAAIKQQKGLNMNIRYITCSDPRNHNTHDEMFDLWKIDPRVEIAVQMHPGKVSPDTERYKWIRQLVDKASQSSGNWLRLAVHVNNDWCDEICNGKIPGPLAFVFTTRNIDDFFPVVERIQLNMPQKTADNFNPEKLKRVIDHFGDISFIIQYNNRTKDATDKLYKTGAQFDLLFDASGGRGESPESWQKPVYGPEHLQGYAGGLKPETVGTELDKIVKVARNRDIWVDIEGGVQKPTGELKPDGKPIKLFHAPFAAKYIRNTLAWEQKHR